MFQGSLTVEHSSHFLRFVILTTVWIQRASSLRLSVVECSLGLLLNLILEAIRAWEILLFFLLHCAVENHSFKNGRYLCKGRCSKNSASFGFKKIHMIEGDYKE